MSVDFEQIIVELTNVPLWNNAMNKIKHVLNQQNNDSIALLFVTMLFQSLPKLEQWTWQTRSQDYRKWVDDKTRYEIFHSLYLFNIKIIEIGAIEAERIVS